jgi:hypothetical protein
VDALVSEAPPRSYDGQPDEIRPVSSWPEDPSHGVCYSCRIDCYLVQHWQSPSPIPKGQSLAHTLHGKVVDLRRCGGMKKVQGRRSDHGNVQFSGEEGKAIRFKKSRKSGSGAKSVRPSLNCYHARRANPSLFSRLTLPFVFPNTVFGLPRHPLVSQAHHSRGCAGLGTSVSARSVHTAVSRCEFISTNSSFNPGSLSSTSRDVGDTRHSITVSENDIGF